MWQKWIEVNDLSSGQYSINKNIRFETSMLRSDLCDYSDAYIVVEERISVTGTNDANRRNKKLTFKNNAPFRPRISSINNTFIDNAEEYSDNYSMTSGSLWNYYRDEVNDYADEENDANNLRMNSNKTKTNEYSEYKTKLIGRTPNNDYKLDAEIVVLLKY